MLQLLDQLVVGVPRRAQLHDLLVDRLRGLALLLGLLLRGLGVRLQLLQVRPQVVNRLP